VSHREKAAEIGLLSVLRTDYIIVGPNSKRKCKSLAQKMIKISR
jgi:hypothetical protein